MSMNDRCHDCPVPEGRRCVGQVRRFCHLAARERKQPDARQHYWLDRIVELSGGLPADRPSFPPRDPGDDRVVFAVRTPSGYLGGAERHISDILEHCDPARVVCGGIAVQSSPTVPLIPTVIDRWRSRAAVAFGAEAARAVVLGCDVLLTWGFRSADTARIVPAGLPVVEISHCAWEANQDHCALPGSTVVAVAEAALAGVPPGRRPGARVIHNAVHPDRVRPSVGWAEQRRRWGVPDGAKVVGQVARIGREKDPELWVDGVAALPPGWVGVWVGTGLHEAEARAHADRVAPGRVIFPGPSSDVGSALRAFDVFAMTSGSEGCCYALAEAWLAPRPAISKRVGLLVERPDLARILPREATGSDVAAAILADDADRAGTMTRVSKAMRFARESLGMDTFGRAWTDLFCEVARPRPGAPPSRPSVDPAVRDRVVACPDRGPVLPISLQSECGCGGGPELTECRAGRGRRDRPGRVTLRECLACRAG